MKHFRHQPPNVANVECRAYCLATMADELMEDGAGLHGGKAGMRAADKQSSTLFPFCPPLFFRFIFPAISGHLLCSFWPGQLQKPTHSRFLPSACPALFATWRRRQRMLHNGGPHSHSSYSNSLRSVSCALLKTYKMAKSSPLKRGASLQYPWARALGREKRANRGTRKIYIQIRVNEQWNCYLTSVGPLSALKCFSTWAKGVESSNIYVVCDTFSKFSLAMGP